MSNYINEAALSKIIEKVKNEMTGVITDIEVKDEVLYFARREYVPASEINYATYVTTEWGSISREGIEEDSAEYVRTGYILASGKTSVTVSTGLGTTIRVLCYDANKTFLTGWNGDYNYQHIDDGESFTIPSTAYYIRVRFSATSLAPVTLAFED